MANREHIELALEGGRSLQAWRAKNPNSLLNLRGADLRKLVKGNSDLSKADLRNADLRYANMRDSNFSGSLLTDARFDGAILVRSSFIGADLRRAVFSNAQLDRANLREADLKDAKLDRARLIGAILSNANFGAAELTSADLSESNLRGTALVASDLFRANFSGADTQGTNFTRSRMGHTLLGNLDLSKAKGLDSITHLGPSTLGIDTVVMSRGALSEAFLRGCGVPSRFIEYIGPLTSEAIQFYSCFISYSTIDQDFAERLHNDLQSNGVRCWFAPEDAQGGRKLHEQIEEAIRVYDKLLIILSPNSMASEWVRTEIANARRREVAQRRRMLFPVSLVDFRSLQEWECFDADMGKDSAREIREYFIPDFREWKSNHDGYRREFQKLLRDLKADAI